MKVGNNTTKTIFDIQVTSKLMSNLGGRKGVCSLARQTLVGKPSQVAMRLKIPFPLSNIYHENPI